jgi:hypothetical protein
MSATTWLIISIIGFSLFGVLLIASVYLFFKLNIPGIIGDLTGKTAAKQIQAIREKNLHSEKKHIQPDVFKIERENLTDIFNEKAKYIGDLTTSGRELAHQSKRLVHSADLRHGNGSSISSGEEHRDGSSVSSRASYRHQTLKNASFMKTDGNSLASLSQRRERTQDFANEPQELMEDTEVLAEEATDVIGAKGNQATFVLGEGTAGTPSLEAKEYMTQVLNDSPQERTTTQVLTESFEEEYTANTQVLNHHTEVLQENQSPEESTQVLQTASHQESHSTTSLTLETELLEDGTDILSDEPSTSVLTETDEAKSEDKHREKRFKFKIVKDIKVIHTNEKI